MTTAWPIWAMLILVAVVHTVEEERPDYFLTITSSTSVKKISTIVTIFSKHSNL